MREQIRKNFKGKKYIVSKYAPKLPQRAEREYARMTNALATEIFKPVLKEHLPELLAILRKADKSAVKTDAKGKIAKQNAKNRTEARLSEMSFLTAEIDSWFDAVEDALVQNLQSFKLASRLNNLAILTKDLAENEWKKAFRKTLGINILDDYYNGARYSEQLSEWVQENINLITALPDEMLARMKKTVMNSYLKGETATELAERIEHDYSTTKSYAHMLARDQTSKLNGQITKYQQQSSGIKRYEWSTAMDERVRDDHAALQGRIFSWDNPPEIGDTGRRCHPQEDYQCRCVALPVFDFDTLDISIDPT